MLWALTAAVPCLQCLGPGPVSPWTGMWDEPCPSVDWYCFLGPALAVLLQRTLDKKESECEYVVA